jgi:nucleotide-binding universal stress UspA family protein
MYKRVVVALDGSELAESILRFILQIAGPLDFEVTLVRVVPADEPDTVVAEAGSYLEQVAAQLVGRGVRVRTEVRRGDAAEQIIAAAHEGDADVIAMTTRGRTGVSRLVMGSVATAVLQTSDLPMLLFRYVERRAA